jgi:hypothetical protein
MLDVRRPSSPRPGAARAAGTVNRESDSSPCTRTNTLLVSLADEVFARGCGVRDELKRLLERIAVAIGEDDAVKAERLLDVELAQYLDQARTDIIVGEAVAANSRTALRTRASKQQSPTGRNGDGGSAESGSALESPPVAQSHNGSPAGIARRAISLEDFGSGFKRLSAKQVVLLVVYEQDGRQAKDVFERLQQLGYEKARNHFSGLSRATNSEWLTNVDGHYLLTELGKEVAEALL